MKILTMTLSFVLALGLAFGPFAALVEARGGGSGGSGGASGGSGAGGGAGAGAGAAGATAGDSGSASSSGSPSTSGSPSASSTASGNSGLSSSPAASPQLIYPAASVAGPQTVTGEVVQIDNASGIFSLRTANVGTLSLQAQPAVVAGVKRGDVIVVEIRPRPAP